MSTRHKKTPGGNVHKSIVHAAMSTWQTPSPPSQTNKHSSGNVHTAKVQTMSIREQSRRQCPREKKSQQKTPLNIKRLKSTRQKCRRQCPLKVAVKVRAAMFTEQTFRRQCPHCKRSGGNVHTANVQTAMSTLQTFRWECPHCKHSGGNVHTANIQVAMSTLQTFRWQCPHCKSAGGKFNVTKLEMKRAQTV